MDEFGYLLLFVAAITSVFFFVTVLCKYMLQHMYAYRRRKSDTAKANRRRLILLFSASLLAMSVQVVRISFEHLEQHAPGMLWTLYAWYALGFIARFLQLLYSREIADRVLGTDWYQVKIMFYFAYLGPGQIPLTAYRIYRNYA